MFQANPYLFTDIPTYSFWNANDKRQAKLDNDYFVSSSSNYLTRPFDIETEQGQRKTKEVIKPLTNLVTFEFANEILHCDPAFIFLLYYY